MSITLNASQINQLTIGGVTVETDGAAAVSGMYVDWVANTLTFDIKKGAVSGGVFTPGAIAQGNVSVVINFATGAWFTNGSGQSGQLAGAGLTNLQNTIKGWRNSSESFANTQSIMPGTTVPW